MRILLVAATSMEIAPLLAGLRRGTAKRPRLDGYVHGEHDVDVLTTGVGMVATAAWCAHILAGSQYDLALNLGVCGSFDLELTPGRVVHVVSDRIAGFGAEDGEAFLPIERLGLADTSECTNVAPPANAVIAGLPAVRAITVNIVHGHEASIADAIRRFNPQVETMEGAAFMYACSITGVAFAQIRAVSNVVERRNRSAWKMTEAIDSLGQTGLSILAHA